MSNLKSAELQFSPFGYATPGEVLESANSTNQYRVESVKAGTIYWRKLDEKIPRDQLKGSCQLP